MRGKGCNIPKELAIPPNSHTKSSQGATAAHNRHLGRCPMIWSLGTSVQARHLDFRPKKWVTGWIPSKRWVPQGGRTEQPDLGLRPFTGISLPYGDWNAGLGGFKSSLFVNFYV
jgi:hypothetical protein